MVAVLSKTGIRLMPTSSYRARKLLAKKKAVICGYRPFTIRLTERETGDVQPVELAVDTGYFHVGNSLKTAKHELAAVEIRTLMDERSKDMTTGAGTAGCGAQDSVTVLRGLITAGGRRDGSRRPSRDAWNRTWHF